MACVPGMCCIMDQDTYRINELLAAAAAISGAYQGRLRGNAFLNDVCDADVLAHVVDVSGTTDSEEAVAAQGEGADPVQEMWYVLLVKSTVFQWVRV